MIFGAFAKSAMKMKTRNETSETDASHIPAFLHYNNKIMFARNI